MKAEIKAQTLKLFHNKKIQVSTSIIVIALVFTGMIYAIISQSNPTPPATPPIPPNTPDTDTTPTNPTTPIDSCLRITNSFLDAQYRTPSNDGLSFETAYLVNNITGERIIFDKVTRYVKFTSFTYLKQDQSNSKVLDVDSCSNIYFENITVVASTAYGFYFDKCTNISLRLSQISGSKEFGIKLNNCSSILMEHVTISDCDDGITLIKSPDITIRYSYFDIPSGIGISLIDKSPNCLAAGNIFNCHNPIELDNVAITANMTLDGTTIGNCYTDYSSRYPTAAFYPVSIIQNALSAYTNGTYVMLGNTFYNKSGFIDYCPLALITPHSTNIEVVASANLTNNIPPTFTINYTEKVLAENSILITYGNYTDRIMDYQSGETIILNSTKWISLTDGSIDVTISLTNYFNLTTSASRKVIKDTTPPIVQFIAPLENSIHNGLSFPINLAVNDISDYLLEYNLNGGLWISTNANFLLNETIWQQQPDGNVTISIRATDILNNTAIYQRIIVKDTTTPNLTVLSPIQMQCVGIEPPSFELVIDEPHIAMIYYTIEGDNLTYVIPTSSHPMGIISWNLWYPVQLGYVNITFHAIDVVGNYINSTVMIERDNTPPFLSIENYSNFDILSSFAPTINLSIYDAHLDSIWYRINKGENISIPTWPFTLNQVLWHNQPDGILLLEIFANDTMGYMAECEILLIKDSKSPIIAARFEEDEISPNIYWKICSVTPKILVNISDVTLDSVWYSLDNSTLHYPISFDPQFNSNSFLIDSILFQNLTDGKHTIMIYANDSWNQISSAQLYITIDRAAPILTILNPIGGVVPTSGLRMPCYITEYHAKSASITVYAAQGNMHLDFILESSEYKNDSIMLFISPAIRENLTDGNYHAKFTVMDIFYNTQSIDFYFTIDKTAPSIEILHPTLNDLHNITTSPLYIIVINDSTPISMISYQIGSKNYSIQEYQGLIDQAAWLQNMNHTITITFFAEDAAGNIGNATIELDLAAAFPPPDSKDNSTNSWELILISVIAGVAVIGIATSSIKKNALKIKEIKK